MWGSITLLQLRESGLVLDWRTVLIGWEKGDGISYVLPVDVSYAEVQELALDALANCAAEDEDTLFRLADAAYVYVRASYVRDLLRKLAPKSGVSEETAARKWRFGFIFGAVEALQTIYASPHRTAYFDEEAAEKLWYLEQDLSEWDLPFAPVKIASLTSADLEQAIITLQAWLVREKAELLPPA